MNRFLYRYIISKRESYQNNKDGIEFQAIVRSIMINKILKILKLWYYRLFRDDTKWIKKNVDFGHVLDRPRKLPDCYRKEIKYYARKK